MDCTQQNIKPLTCVRLWALYTLPALSIAIHLNLGSHLISSGFMSFLVGGYVWHLAGNHKAPAAWGIPMGLAAALFIGGVLAAIGIPIGFQGITALVVLLQWVWSEALHE